MPRAKAIQIIHVGARQLGLIDATLREGDPDRDALYRALIAEATGGQATSCGECSDVQLDDVLSALKRQGFRVEPSRSHGRRPKNMSDGDMRTQVEAQLTNMGLPWSYAEAILRRQRGLPKEIGCPVSTATALELRALVAALDVEQRKRAWLADVDAGLAKVGKDRAWLAAQMGAKKGWERRQVDLRRAIDYLVLAAVYG